MKQAYNHDYSGNCAPGKSEEFGNETFSVGIFQWLPKASGKGLKKSAVKFRVKGNVSCADRVYDAAKLFCKLMDGGLIPKTKSTTV